MSSKIAGRIVDVAIECFARDGFHGATTKDISKRADVTEGSLFRLYGSKEKLFEAAIRSSFASDRIPINEFVDILEGGDSFERSLRSALLKFFEGLDARFVRLGFFAMLERPDLARAYFVTPSNSITRAVSRAIEREIYRRNLREDIDPMIAAHQLTGALWHVAFVSPIFAAEFKVGTRAARRDAVQKFVEIWFRGMEHRGNRKTNVRRKK